jgi:membrane-bound metal-dependent hydrolase YbcI (DUF457 family)
MACGATHAFAGAVAGSAAFCSEEEGSLADLFVACGSGVIGGKLPDKLEPALHPNHRKFFHSLLFAAGVGYAGYKVYKWGPETDWQKVLRIVLLAVAAGYLSHLLLDSLTPKSLPVIGL